VVSERNGTWSRAIEVPGTARLNGGDEAEITSVSCASAGNCSAGGQYLDSTDFSQAFVVSERNGTWGTAIETPGTANLNQGGDAGTTSVSCASADNCSAGGFYSDGGGFQQAFVAGERNGTWGTAIEAPGTVNLNRGGRLGAFAEITSVSCASVEHCGAGGFYTDSAGHIQAFVIGET
jgi:hypothetical protein